MTAWSAVNIKFGHSFSFWWTEVRKWVKVKWTLSFVWECSYSCLMFRLISVCPLKYGKFHFVKTIFIHGAYLIFPGRSTLFYRVDRLDFVFFFQRYALSLGYFWVMHIALKVSTIYTYKMSFHCCRYPVLQNSFRVIIKSYLGQFCRTAPHPVVCFFEKTN